MLSDSNGHKAKKASGKPRKPRRTVTREQKAEMVALLPELGSQTAVAQEFDVDRSVVTRAVADPEIAQIARVKKEHLADKFGQLVDKLLARHLEIAHTATLDDKSSTLLGIAADKHRLYSEEPTQITENRGDAATRESALKTLADLTAHFGGDEAKAREWMAAETPTLHGYIH